MAFAGPRPSGGQRSRGRPPRCYWGALVSEWGSTEGACPSLAAPGPGHCPYKQPGEPFPNPEEFFKAMVKIVGSLKLAVVGVFIPWKLAYATNQNCSSEACLPGYRWSLSSQLSPPRQHSGQASSVLWVQPIPLSAGPSLRPGHGGCPGFCKVSLPGLSALTPATSCPRKLSSLEYGGASSLWHCWHPRLPPPGWERSFSLASRPPLHLNVLICKARALALCPFPHRPLYTKYLLSARPQVVN